MDNPTPPTSEESPERKTKSFPEKAAYFAMLSAVLMLAYNFYLAKDFREMPSASVFLGIISVVVCVLSLIAAIIALAGIPRHGKKGILTNALIAIGIDVVTLGLATITFVLASRGALPRLEDLDVRKQLVGVWVTTDKTKDFTISMYLNQDNTFRFHMIGSSVADFSGKWSVQNRRLFLNVETVKEGNRANIENVIRWKIDSVSSDELVLGATNGQDHYRRTTQPD